MFIDEKALKVTVSRDKVEPSGLPLKINETFRLGATHFLRRCQSFFKRLQTPQHPAFLASSFLQAQLVDGAYDQSQFQFDAQPLIAGPNSTELPCDVFIPSTPELVSTQQFHTRTHLRVQRTLMNIEALEQAYPEEFELDDLKHHLQSCNLQAPPHVLRHQLMTLTKGRPFLKYQELKDHFLGQWLEQRQDRHAQVQPVLMNTDNLQGCLKALLGQKHALLAGTDVLRYTDYQFFRYFNAQSHPALQSNALDFWKSEEVRDGFHQLVQGIQTHFGDTVPYHVFRFRGGFTYFLCGFSDEGIRQATLDNEELAPVHAKIIIRQQDKTFCEISAAADADVGIYHHCLKDALLPFIENLNHRLNLQLPEAFLHFFKK